MSTTETFDLIYDTELRAPACVLLQAAFGCGCSNPAFRHFDSTHWLVNPTPGMRRMTGTDADWKRVAEVTRKRWGNNRPTRTPTGIETPSAERADTANGGTLYSENLY